MAHHYWWSRWTVCRCGQLLKGLDVTVNPIVIHRYRTERITVKLRNGVGSDPITSQIRTRVNPTSTKIADFEVDVSADGRTIWLTLDDSVTREITVSGGYMDIKRISGGEPVNVIDTPIPVVFKNVVTP